MFNKFSRIFVVSLVVFFASFSAFAKDTIKIALIEIAKSNDFSLDLRIKSLQALSKFEDSSVLDDIIGMLEQSENYIFYNE